MTQPLGQRGPWQRWLVNVSLVLGSLVAGLLIAEASVHLLGWDPAAQRGQRSARMGLRQTPGVHSFHASGDDLGLVEERLDANGRRDRDHPIPEPFRILVLGDSFAFGLGLEWEETFPAVLERTLWRHVPDAGVGVYNTGQNGISQVLQFEILRRSFPRIRPQLVVLGFFEGNDIDENITQNPFFYRLTNPTTNSDDIVADLSALSTLTVAKDFFYHHSALVRFFRQRTVTLSVLREVHRMEGMLASWSNQNLAVEDILTGTARHRFVGAFGTRYDDDWPVTLSLLERIRGFVEARGAELVLFRIPARYAVNEAEWKVAVRQVCGETPEEVATFCGTVDPLHTANRLRAYAQEHDLLWVDPGTRLQQASRAGERLYGLNNDVHWNPRGQRLAGTWLAEALAAHQWGISPRPTPPHRPLQARTLAGLWYPPAPNPDGLAPSGGQWFSLPNRTAEQEAVQYLRWAQEAGLDALVLPWLTGDDPLAQWVNSETERMIAVLHRERERKATYLSWMLRTGTSRPDVPQQSPPLPNVTPPWTMVSEHTNTYFRACNRPLIIASSADASLLDRQGFAVVSLATDATGSMLAPGSDVTPTPISRSPCSDLAQVAWVAPHTRDTPGPHDSWQAVRAYEAQWRGARETEPDLILLDSLNQWGGPSSLAPVPQMGRFWLMVTHDLAEQWKAGRPFTRLPEPLLLAYREPHRGPRRWFVGPGESSLVVKGGTRTPSGLCLGAGPATLEISAPRDGLRLAIFHDAAIDPGQQVTIRLDDGPEQRVHFFGRWQSTWPEPLKRGPHRIRLHPNPDGSCASPWDGLLIRGLGWIPPTPLRPTNAREDLEFPRESKPEQLWPQDRNVLFHGHPNLELDGFFPPEGSLDGPFFWSRQETATIRIIGLQANAAYGIALRFAPRRFPPRVRVASQDGSSQTRVVPADHTIHLHGAADNQGRLTMSLSCTLVPARERHGRAQDDRLVGAAIRAVTVGPVASAAP